MAKKEKQFEDISSYSSKNEYKKAKISKSGGHIVIKSIIIFFSILCIVIGGAAIYAGNVVFSSLSTTTITKDLEELGITEGTVTHDEITNIVFYGVDSRSMSFSGLSDVIMIMSIDEANDTIKLTSVLRDSRVYMGDDYTWTSTGYDKINHAYSYGGAEFAIKTLNTNFGLDVQDYVTVNFYYMAEIIDAFGGVDIELSSTEIDVINSMVSSSDYLNASAGTVHLNGNQAVAFSRIRKIDSDNERAIRQQEVLSALLILTTEIPVTEYVSLITQMTSLCETSLDLTEIMDLAPIVTTGFTIETKSIPGDTETDLTSGLYENNAWMWNYDLEAASENLIDFIYGDLLEDFTA